MPDLSSLFCANCGTPLGPPAKGAPGITCPICQLFTEVSDSPAVAEMTLETLEVRLGDLVAQARASGLPLFSIVHLLRDELEFTAELASGDRDLCIQIIDLGPRTRQPMRRSSHDASMLLRGRTAGG